MGLRSKLQANDKKGIFKRTGTVPSYTTGFTNLDYYNGYRLMSFDENDNVVKTQSMVGMVGGSFITVIGKPGVAKTTAAIQMALNIVKPFEDGLVEHFDLEQAMSYTRIKNISQLRIGDLSHKYILKQEKCTIEDIYDACEAIYKEKTSNRKEYEYDSGLFNEFNEPIKALVPTVVITDSIPTITTRDAKDEMEGGTYANRVAKAIAQFYKKMTPIIKEANIIFIAINHINTKIEINPMMKTQAQTIYMKADESMPGGNAPIYYANNVFKFVTKEKIVEEKEGFDGFVVSCQFIKSRTNKAGKETSLVYNQAIGFDPILTQLQVAKDRKILMGNAPHNYFPDFPTVKFNRKKFRKEMERDEVRNALLGTTMPILEQQLSSGLEDQDQTDESNFDCMLRAMTAYSEDEKSFEEMNEEAEKKAS